ncbi:DUF3772 domain-containing protein [Methylobacterium tarhaniae]|uniref:DUF3772 domain-containing protein n=1 Tax=Methylobacterium tarhaniae TaxID=1187852 RepID=UPI003D040872
MRVPSSLKSHAPGRARLSARAARRLTLPPLLIVLLSIWLALPAAAQTGGLVPETRQLLRETEEALPRIEQDYAGALRARNAIEPLREALRARLQQLERRQRDFDQQVARLGPKPAWDETEAVAAQRRELAALQAAFEAEYRPVLLAAQQSEQMWHRLTEIRRTLFAKRLTMNVASILDPIFWRDVATVELPRFAVQTEQLLRSWADYVSSHDTVEMGLALLACTVGLVLFVLRLHRRIAERARTVEAQAEAVTERAALQRGAIVFVMRALPLPLAALLFAFVARHLDVAPPEVDEFLTAVAIALLVLGTARGAMGALLAPRAARWRIVRASDDSAAAVTFMVVGALDLYTAGIIATSFQTLVGQRIETEIATIMVLTVAMIGLVAVGFRRLDRASGPPAGFVTLDATWTRPIVSLVCVAAGLCLAFGYVALAGFLSGRLAMSCLAVAVAILIVTTLDQLLDRGQASQTRAGAALAAMLGLSHHAIDLAGVALSGLTRLAVIVTTGLIVLAPWGLEYGDVNPFGDFAAWFATTDLRSGLGTFGFALLAFVLGIVGTKLVVDWMDTALLPRTSLDPSLRHSIRTVLGYAGFAVTALGALSLMGINAQNIAVIAGALSIGIGFGLQSIVGNFVSGLILLAERPVRVGDVVVIKGEEGRVQRISVRSTVIGTFQQASVVIPNSDLIASVVRNRNLANANLELRFTLVLDHDADVARADAVVVTAAEGHANVLKTPKPRVLFVRITEIGQELEVRCSADRFENKRQVRSDLHHRIAEAFRQEGLRFARYPHAMAALSTSAQAEDTD